ncbi:4-(cytidine 5'-diphospho)-2-C-methyl-D-erythritol kinase [Halomonas sp. HAL1]|uniref:4-(cytidine 5'-diphospho)-2-C-methyl-D-erythritol kinase n=1 Tax=Halomonas sp. HAL1 TaxID=550984 RepID=UPI00022D3449|nr:4-(cytidine 5'-diphospho)-2-C-methyl-D-erythritol kinase [Halomonas sp. HAL1]EHA16248.1 4-diphosphocytidyl-2-C-methyl-D-erythritolkinase [Halomonas sp. HAL1]WKV91925.1 4-(cytidine 5'-diphospho)-2-C-methyl-D-erythritol kinase [Halomonas sp. HAL1]
MNAQLRLPAPAKLNRMLHIVGRREDGYHTLQTLFQFIDLNDHLTLTARDDGEIHLTHEVSGVSHDDNLIVRAARLLQRHSGTRLGATLTIEKQLPMGGGLGGGSSNAATTLVGLNHLWQLHLSLDELARLGLQLGADVPVFVHGYSAWAEGVGEQLTAVTLDTPWFVIIHPDISVSTLDVFQDPQLTRDSHPITMARALQGGAPEWRNDCEAVVKERYPPIAEALHWLAQHAPSRLTGTGACLFAAFETQQAAQAIAQLAGQRWPTWVARGLNTSPLHDALGFL